MKYIQKLAELLEKIIDDPSVDSNILENNIKPAKKNVDADFAINCFALMRYFKKKGPEIAQEINGKFKRKIIEKNNFIKSVEIAGPYLNFKIDKKIMARNNFSQIYRNIDEYAKSRIKEEEKSKRIVIEYPAPNTNKPLHLGHIRNMLLGQALSVLNKLIGNKTFEVNLLNDRGIHICKSMWAYKKFGNNKTPKSENLKSDHFVGRFYVKFAKEESRFKRIIEKELIELENEKEKTKKEQNKEKIKELEKIIDKSKYGNLQTEIKNMLIKWEEQDIETRNLWRKMNDWAEKGFSETFSTLNIHHEKIYYESKIYNKGKDIVIQGLNDGIFKKLPDGAIIAEFKKKNLPKRKVLIRNDGSTLYATQDLNLAFQKMKDFQYDKSIYIVGNEQDMQLRIIFAILKKLGMKADNYHYSYGMINLTSGKMKSREGTVVDADAIIEELYQLSLNEIKERYSNLPEIEIKNRARIIGMAALRFFILKYDYSRDFLFDPKESISFEGETGPYILYSYARICSIYMKALENNYPVPYNPERDRMTKDIEIKDEYLNLLKDEHESNLINLLYKYPIIIKNTALNLKPHLLARYIYELSQEFTSFYHSCRIIDEKENLRNSRMLLIEAIRIVIKHGLKQLSIDVLSEM